MGKVWCSGRFSMCLGRLQGMQGGGLDVENLVLPCSCQVSLGVGVPGRRRSRHGQEEWGGGSRHEEL